jgi:hypothetical protein
MCCSLRSGTLRPKLRERGPDRGHQRHGHLRRAAVGEPAAKLGGSEAIWAESSAATQNNFSYAHFHAT